MLCCAGCLLNPTECERALNQREKNLDDEKASDTDSMRCDIYCGLPHGKIHPAMVMLPVESNPAEKKNPSTNMIDLSTGLPEDFNNLPNYDYLETYTTICSQEQKQQYKTDYMADFEEYQRVYQKLDELGQSYIKLQKAWRDMDRNNPQEVEEIQQQVLETYRRNKGSKPRYEYLQKKLTHIKRLVTEYDDKLREPLHKNKAE